MKKGILENFAKFSKTPFLQNTSGKLPLPLAFQKQPPEVFYEKVFLKISQNSQENNFGLRNFKNTFSTEHLRKTVSAFTFSEAATGDAL